MPRHEQYVIRTDHNVIPLHPRKRLPEELPVPLEHLGVVVKDLGRLTRAIKSMVRSLHWPALEWKTVCTPLMLGLPEAQQSLADLAGIRAGQWPDTEWAVRLRAACNEAERRLLDVSVSLSSLIHGTGSGADAVICLSLDSIKLTEAMDEICDLIASRYPKAVVGI